MRPFQVRAHKAHALRIFFSFPQLDLLDLLQGWKGRGAVVKTRFHPVTTNHLLSRTLHNRAMPDKTFSSCCHIAILYPSPYMH